MFGKKMRPPTVPFVHTDGCTIVRADPDYEPAWQEVERGLFQRECQCSKEFRREDPADGRVRLDPLDPTTSRHLPQCEHRDTSDPALLRLILKVTDKGQYSWVECVACQGGWQVPHYGAASVG